MAIYLIINSFFMPTLFQKITYLVTCISLIKLACHALSEWKFLHDVIMVNIQGSATNSISGYPNQMPRSTEMTICMNQQLPQKCHTVKFTIFLNEINQFYYITFINRIQDLVHLCTNQSKKRHFPFSDSAELISIFAQHLQLINHVCK